MSGSFKDREHLVRMAGLFAAGTVVFVVVRALLVPEGFGEYGHYRAGALADNRAYPLRHAGHEACGDCHGDVLENRADSRHEAIGCEACHGPLADHAAAPDEVAPVLPEGAAVCLPCHAEVAAKPPSFPQVDPVEHADGAACTECHDPHHPEVQP